MVVSGGLKGCLDVHSAELMDSNYIYGDGKSQDSFNSGAAKVMLCAGFSLAN
jgi:hypothetical protein